MKLLWLKIMIFINLARVNVKILLKLPSIIMMFDRRLTKLDADIQAMSDVVLNDKMDAFYAANPEEMAKLIASHKEVPK